MKYFLMLIGILCVQLVYSQKGASNGLEGKSRYELHVMKAQVYYRDYKEDSIGPAMKSFSRAIATEPNNPYAYWLRGDMKSKLGDKYGAIKDFDLAIEKDPSYIDAWNDRSIAKSEIGNWQGAYDDIDMIMTIFLDKEIVKWGNITTDILIFNAAVCNLQLGRIKDACSLFSTAGELGNTDAYVQIRKHCK